MRPLGWAPAVVLASILGFAGTSTGQPLPSAAPQRAERIEPMGTETSSADEAGPPLPSAPTPPSPKATVSDSAPVVPFATKARPWPSYVPSPSSRGVALVLIYLGALEAIGAGIGAAWAEIDRVTIASKYPVNSCLPSRPTRPDYCWQLADRIETRDNLGAVAGATALATVSFWMVMFFNDYLETRTPIVAPAPAKDGAGLVLIGAW